MRRPRRADERRPSGGKRAPGRSDAPRAKGRPGDAPRAKGRPGDAPRAKGRPSGGLRSEGRPPGGPRGRDGGPSRRTDHQRKERGPARPGRGGKADDEVVFVERDAPRARPALLPASTARIGDWLLTTRAGYEQDLADELSALRPPSDAALLAPALVVTARVPLTEAGAPDLVFARQGFRVVASLTPDVAALCAAIATALADDRPFVVHAWVADADASNVLASRAAWLADAVVRALCASSPELAARHVTGGLPPGDAQLVQLCLVREDLVLVGWSIASLALSPFPGGRARMRSSGKAPARSAMKLSEAFAWLGIGPGAGDVTVDLGAAPGGWTSLLLSRRARVIAVDPAKMNADLAKDSRLRHVRASAFDWEPEEPQDWLFCDMAWRPLEVAALLAKWGRRRWARLLVANFKLPMKRKVDMMARVREILATGGWRDARVRHLYHDRDEVTLFARC